MAALAGTLAMAVTGQQSAGPSPSVALTTVSAEVQQAIDGLLDAMQQAVAYDMALPYSVAGSEDELLTSLQNTNYQLLIAGVSRVTELFNGWFFQSPEVVAGAAANSRQYFDFFTPDIYYHVTAGLAPGATYVLTGTLGGATEHFSISTEAITAGTAQTVGSLELGHGLVVNPDGTFTVYIGPDEPAGAVNFMDDSDATVGGAASLLIRDMLGDWAQGPGSVSIHCVADCPPFFAIPEGGFFPGDDGAGGAGSPAAPIGSIDSMLTTLFNAFAQVVGPFNQRAMDGAAAVGMATPANTMADLSSETHFGAGLESALVSGGNFALGPGEALILQLPNVPSAYSGIELMNVYGAALPYTLAQTTLNNTTAFHSEDGYTYYVVSATNPGVANWLDSGDATTGEIFARYENVADPDAATGLDVQAWKVPIAEVGDYLPDDTPTVSAAEYAADMARRVLSFDYALDVSRMNAQPSWLIQQLLLDALKGVLGTDNFEQVFGEQPFTPLELRFTDALSPDWDAVWHAVSNHPFESLSAIVNNLDVAWSDISLPIGLALGRTVLSLLLPTQSGSLFDDAFLDPNTGIIAGLLNARDDLATAILAATGDWPSELGEQAAQQWAAMPELIEQATATMPTNLGELFAMLFGAD